MDSHDSMLDYIWIIIKHREALTPGNSYSQVNKLPYTKWKSTERIRVFTHNLIFFGVVISLEPHYLF